MNPAKRGILALCAAVILALLPRLWLADASSLWTLLLLPVMGLAGLATLGRQTSMFDDPRRWLGLVASGIVIVGIFMFGSSLYDSIGPSSGIATLGWLVGACVVGSFAFLMSRPGGEGIPAVVFFVVYTVTVLWVVANNHPVVDAAMFQEEASLALAEGINPYAITFLDPYDAASSQLFYGTDASVDGVLQFGFIYLPLSLLAVAPFEWVFSDFRVAHVLALVATGVLMSQLGGGRESRAASAGFLLISPVLYITMVGWTEPLLILALVSVLYVNGRSSRFTPYAVGIALALKQYAVLLLPASLLLRPRPWSARQIGSDLLKIGAVVMVVTVPFFLWDPEAFIRSVVELQFLLPFRFDSIALPALWAQHFGKPADSIIVLMPLVGVAVVTVAAWFRAPTGSQGFALTSALTLLVAFALSKQAFANYYLPVLALLFSAAALVGGKSVDDITSIDASSSVPSVKTGSERNH